jgi:hypothetical protein
VSDDDDDVDAELAKPFVMDVELLLLLLNPLTIGAAPFTKLYPFDMGAAAAAAAEDDDDDELVLEVNDIGAGDGAFAAAVPCSPTSLRHASKPPTSIIGMRFSSFVNAVSLINRTRTDIGVFDPPSVCDDWSYTTIRSNLSRFLNIVVSFVGALAMLSSRRSAVSLRVLG